MIAENLPDGRATSEAVAGGQPGTVVELDCSHGESDIPDDQWCTGELVGVSGPAEPAAAPHPPEAPLPAPVADPAG